MNLLQINKDSTLIKTKSGARFPKNADDWIFWDNKVETKL